MTNYRFGDRIFDSDRPDSLALIATIHANRKRPLCVCAPPGIEMYVARVGTNYVIKRMPDSGGLHTPDCVSYEPPAALSGLGELQGGAIQDGGEEGVKLKFGFSMAKTAARLAPNGEGDSDSVKADTGKLSLRGILHFLWEDAGLNRWRPGMEGKRKYGVVHRCLSQAMDGKTANKAPLGDSVFVPEPFYLDRKDEIAKRRIERMAPVLQAPKGKKPLMLAIGEMKSFQPSRHGSKALLKHLPDFPLYMSEDIYRKMQKRFSVELELWDAYGEEDVHMMIAATFSVGVAGFANVEEATLMPVTAAWMPFENNSEKELLDALVREKRSFIRGMRYNMARDRPMACAVVNDTVPAPVALYVLPPQFDTDFEAVLKDLVDESKVAPWFWNPGRDIMPPLPASQGFVAMAMPAGMAEAPAA